MYLYFIQAEDDSLLISSFLFFYNDIDRYWYYKKWHQKDTITVVHGGPLYRENKKRFQGLGRSWSYLWMRVLEDWRLKCSWEDGQGMRVPVPRSHRDKRIGEYVCPVSIQFKCDWALSLRELCISRK